MAEIHGVLGNDYRSNLDHHEPPAVSGAVFRSGNEYALQLLNFFRDYDQTIGRYVQNDPIGLEGGNLFVYPQNPILEYNFSGLLKYSSKVIWKDLTKCPSSATIARTQWDNRSLEVRCSQTGCNEWVLDEFIANADISMAIPPAGSPIYSGECTRQRAIEAEFQHVQDLQKGISKSRRKLQEVENKLKGEKYSSQAECELSSQVEAFRIWLDPMTKAMSDTIAKWDASGKHKCMQ